MEKKSKIIIIGAGIAGLIAAKKLSPYFDCLILEASNRVGGRINTTYWQDTPVELGAVAVQGVEHNPIVAIAQQINLGMKKIEGENSVIKNKKGDYITPEQIKVYDEIYYNLCEKAANFSRIHEKISLSEGIQKFLPTEPAIPEEYILWKNRIMGGYFGMDFTELSAEFYDQEKVLPGGNYIVTDGYEKIINFFEPENLNITLNASVTEINYSHKNNIKITVNNSQIYECQQVVITVPLGVLKKQEIKFTPQLPDKKISAIKNMDMGVLNKIILFFDECFWPKDAQKLAYLSSEAKIAVFLSYYERLNKPVIAGFMGGFSAQALENLDDDEIIEYSCKDLSQILDQKIPKPRKAFITRWSKEVGYYGSYSCLRKGVPAEMYDVLGQPVENKLFFAGEATMKDFPGTVHGAYFSGVLAARNIMALYNLKDNLKINGPDELELVYKHQAEWLKVNI